MIREKTKLPKTLGLTSVAEILGLHELFFPCFLAFVNSKKINKKYQRKSSTLIHAVVNNNEF